ncbi:hypothetical protein [Nocardia sp. NPDC051832]|uniref:hypothetical protein n=1 Tax=Nocardia sp. NPDC051832 TaxID=3155673 RepID=UPI003432D2B3
MSEMVETERGPRLAIGEVAGPCQFVMDGEGHLCGRPVHVKSLLGRLPKYCEEVVEGIRHDGKNAAKARKLHGFNAATPIHTSPAPVEATVRPISSIQQGEVSLQSVPAPTVPQKTDPSISSAAVPEEMEEQELPVTESISRFEQLVGRFEEAARRMSDAAEAAGIVLPEARQALEIAGAAESAEIEISQIVANAEDDLTDARIKREAAEAKAKRYEEDRRKMAAERDEARAEAKKAVSAAESERDQARQEADEAVKNAEAVKQESLKGIEAAEKESAAAKQEALAANESAKKKVEAEQQRANREIAEVQKHAQQEVAAANAAQKRAEGEAEQMRKQVDQLSKQLEQERADRRTDAERYQKREDEHRDEMNETNRYWHKELREAYKLAGRQHLPPDDNAEPWPGAEGASPARRDDQG